MEVFLSHSHGDRLIARAVKDLLQDVFGDEQMDVQFSSDQAAGKGVGAGAEWREWIRGRVEQANVTVVIVTPRSRTSQWVLWEAGAVEGYAAARDRDDALVPLVFGVEEDDLPDPFRARQCVRGDTQEENGVLRLLQMLNEHIDLPQNAFEAVTGAKVPPYIANVVELTAQSVPPGGLLVGILNSFPAQVLEGYWATAYTFKSDGVQRVHVDIASVTHDEGCHLRATNRSPMLPRPATEGRRNPFFNEIEADLVNRHVIGRWRNRSDASYFGSVHLAVLSEENVMQGYYTALQGDEAVACERWKWVRLELGPAGVAGFHGRQLKPAQDVWRTIDAHGKHDGSLALDTVTEPTP